MNQALFTDYYELTMANAYFKTPLKDTVAYFDYFFRNIPDNGGYVIFLGIDDVLTYLRNLSFSKSEIAFLKSKGIFDPTFLKYLETFKFTGEVYAVLNGTPIFPHEPVLTIKANIIEAQIIETFLLNVINHQSRIATKASRIVRASGGENLVMEFGARRAHGYDAGVSGAKAAYLAGCAGTSLTVCDYNDNIPALGTMAHSFVQAYESEYEAFLAYAKTYPDQIVLLIDTYNTLSSGVVNAIKLYNDYLKPNNLKLHGVRIDSGDLVYLSKEVRKLLDDAGLVDTKIVASNSLDEYLITSLKLQGAKLDSYGIGERLITAKSDPILDGVYKLCALEENGKIIPKIKVSNTLAKTTTPGFKQVYRFYNYENKAIADVVTLYDEIIDSTKPYTLFDPNEPWKKTEIVNFKAIPLKTCIFKNGKSIYKKVSLVDTRNYIKFQLDTLWDEVKRFENPHTYYVDLSQKLWDLKHKMVCEHQK